MRSMIAVSTVVGLIFFATAALAEKRIFIIANNDDGYGVDQCLAGGESCGHVVANSYCRSHEFAQAVSFHKVDRDDITGDIPATGFGSCHGNACARFVAIECAR